MRITFFGYEIIFRKIDKTKIENQYKSMEHEIRVMRLRT